MNKNVGPKKTEKVLPKKEEKPKSKSKGKGKGKEDKSTNNLPKKVEKGEDKRPRAKTGYNLFSEENRAKIAKDHPGALPKEIMTVKLFLFKCFS